jgi:hypothetical protein
MEEPSISKAKSFSQHHITVIGKTWITLTPKQSQHLDLR